MRQFSQREEFLTSFIDADLASNHNGVDQRTYYVKEIQHPQPIPAHRNETSYIILLAPLLFVPTNSFSSVASIISLSLKISRISAPDHYRRTQEDSEKELRVLSMQTLMMLLTSVSYSSRAAIGYHLSII